jgi:hypothetical protein
MAPLPKRAGAVGECGGGGSLHCGQDRQGRASWSGKLPGMWASLDVSETALSCETALACGAGRGGKNVEAL